MCLALSLVFGVMSSQAQAIGNSTQVLAKIDSTILKFRNSPVWGWRFQPHSIVSHPDYVKYSENSNICISLTKSLFLFKQQWIPYGILGMIEHTKKILEGCNSLSTNLFGLSRQIAIATDGKYTRGGTQILEQLTSDERDVAKISEGIGYILKGMGWHYYYPFIGASQYLVSSYRAFFTPIHVQHYTPSTVYRELTEISKQIGASIDITLGMDPQHNLFYKAKGTLGMSEQMVRMRLNDATMYESTYRVLTHGLYGVRRGLTAAIPFWAVAFWVPSLQLATDGAIAFLTVAGLSCIHSIFSHFSDKPDIMPPMSPLLTHPNMSFPLPRQIKLEVEEEKSDTRGIEILKYHGHRYVELSKEQVAQIEHGGWKRLNIDIKHLKLPRYFVLPEDDNADPTKDFSMTCPAL